MKLFGYLNVHSIRGAFTLILQYFGHLKIYNIGGIFVECLINIICVGVLSLCLLPPPLSSVSRSILLVCRLLLGIGFSHMTEDSVKVFPGV